MDEDERRFTEVYDATRTRVWAYAVSRVGRELADEMVSDAYVVAWRRFAEIPADPLPWLLGITRNVIRGSHRARARRESLAAELASWTRFTEGDIADQVTEQASVLAALSTLSEADREVLILVAWHDMGVKDAAAVCGCSPAALRMRLHRARNRLTAAVSEFTAATAPRRAGLLEWS